MPAVELVRPLRLAPGGGTELTVVNRGSNSAYYGQDATVSSSNKTGTLAVGESLTLTKGYVWIVAEKTPVILDLHEVESGGVGGEAKALVETETARAETAEKAIGPLVNIKKFGAKCDGTTDDTAAWEAGIASGEPLTWFGTSLTSKLTITTGLALIGQGYGSVLKLRNGVKDNLLETKEFQTLLANPPTGVGPQHFVLRNFLLDGNKANNASPAANKGHCVALLGNGFNIDGVWCKNGARNGLYSTNIHEEEAASATDGFYEPVIRNVRCWHNAINGFEYYGPSSAFIQEVLCANNGSTGIGLLAGGSTSYWVNCRSWGFQEYAVKVEGHEQFVNCAAEEGRVGTLYFHDSLGKWIGGFIFNQTEEPSGALIKIGAAGHTAEEIQLENFRAVYNGTGATPTLDIENDGGNSRIVGVIHHIPAHAAIKGTPKETTALDLKITGSTTTLPTKTPGEAWQALTLEAHVQQRTSRLAHGVRLENGRVFLRGQVEIITAEVKNTEALAKLPAGVPAPASIVELVHLDSAETGALIIETDGKIKSNNNLPIGKTIKLDDLSYSV